jgi:hypothetical protein
MSLSEFAVLNQNRDRLEKEVEMWKRKADQSEEKLCQERKERFKEWERRIQHAEKLRV